MNLFRVFLVIINIGLAAVSAQAGNEGGGGDPCENRIKVISQDIKSWIINGGAKELVLPEDISVENYSSSMLAQINKAQVTCVDEKDPGYPVQVNNEPKVCRFDRQSNSSKITCDIRKFQTLSETEQYILIHHEYAGLSGLEKPKGANSSYEISNQISGYLEDQIVKKLAVKKTEHINPTTPFEKLKKAFNNASKIDTTKFNKSGSLTCLWSNDQFRNPYSTNFEVIGSDILLVFTKFHMIRNMFMLEDKREHIGYIKYTYHPSGKIYDYYFVLRQSGKNVYLKFDIVDEGVKRIHDIAKCVIN